MRDNTFSSSFALNKENLLMTFICIEHVVGLCHISIFITERYSCLLYKARKK